MKFITVLLALSVCCFAQAPTQYSNGFNLQVLLPVSTTITQWHPINVSGGTVSPATNLAFGIAITGAVLGGSAWVQGYGFSACEFKSAPTVGNLVAVTSDGYCSDTGTSDRGTLPIVDGVFGSIFALRPDIGANFAEVDMIYPASRGVQVDYNNLLHQPTIPAAQVQTDWTAVSGLGVVLHKPTLATVATSGSYTDLTSKPTIPAAQVNSDWTASSGLPQILNKPTLATVATTGIYSDLTGKPTLPSTFPQCFNSSGTISNCKIWVGSATTNSSGVATFNLTAAGFSAAPTMCSFMATATASAANSLNVTGVTGYTATQAQAFVTQPISLLGLGLLPVALVNGATVQAACTGA